MEAKLRAMPQPQMLARARCATAKAGRALQLFGKVAGRALQLIAK